jgi:NitT/TauT family transport system substrate-binding protein
MQATKRSRPFTWARLSAIALVVALALSACADKPGSRQAAPGKTAKVRIGVGGQPLLAYLPTTLAKELGYYRDEGVDVELQDLQAGSKALEAMLGGSTDVTSGYYDHTVQMAAKQQPVVAFVNILRYPALVLAVSPKAEDQIRSVADLKGKTVGVTSPGSSTDFFLKHMLAKNGLATDAASVQAIGADATAVGAMEQGQVDAAVLLEPAYSQLEKRAGKLTVLSDTRTKQGVERAYGTSTYPAAVLYAAQAWLENNPDTARKLARAMQRTLAWVQSHSAEQIAAKMPPQFSGEAPELYVRAIAAMKATFNPTGELDKAGAEAVRDVLAQSQPEIKQADVDVAKTYTNKFLER